SAAAALNANITVNGYSPNSALSAYSYGIPQDEAARTGVGSADIASNSYTGVGSTFAFTFPSYAATFLALNRAQPPPARPPRGTPSSAVKDCLVTSTSIGDNLKSDAVKARVTVN